MKELRRLMIEKSRINKKDNMLSIVNLTNKEIHYLTNVLRLSKGEKTLIVDGEGGIWESIITGKTSIELNLISEHKSLFNSSIKPPICIAIVIPKNGFEEILRMTCEIGVDIIQPLVSTRSVKMAESNLRRLRWNQIIKESFEQSERLWLPEIRKTLKYKEWIFEDHVTKNYISIAKTRLKQGKDMEDWLQSINKTNQGIWTLIGPEGGWTKDETKLAKDLGISEVNLGNYIMRTSTASIVAVQIMSRWRTSLNHLQT